MRLWGRKASLQLTSAIHPMLVGITLTVVCLVAGAAPITDPLVRYGDHHLGRGNPPKPIYLAGAGFALHLYREELEYRQVLDHYAANGMNCTQFWTCPDVWDNKNYAWAEKPGSGLGNDGKHQKYDLNTWNPVFWSFVHKVLSYTRDKGLYVEVSLFDECGIERGSGPGSGNERWLIHPFNPDNNVNGLSLPTGNTDAVPEFYNVSDPDLLGFQTSYVKKLIAETCHYPNVYYHICNEYTGPWEWARHWIDLIEARCDKLIGANPFTNIDEHLAYPALDIVNYHIFTDRYQEINSRFTSSWGRNKPLGSNEPLGHMGAKENRMHAWTAFVSGAYFNGMDSIETIPVYEELPPYLGRLVQFTETCNFAEMAPNNSLIKSVPSSVKHAFAMSGDIEAVVYMIGTGGGELVLNLGPGNYVVRWYEPATGVSSVEISLTATGGIAKLTIPPFKEDHALLIQNRSSAFFSDFTPGGTVDSKTPKCSVSVRGLQHALDPSSARAEYSRDGGRTWHPVKARYRRSSVSKKSGVIRARAVPFRQKSDTLNRIRFSIKDVEGGFSQSPEYQVKIASPVTENVVPSAR